MSEPKSNNRQFPNEAAPLASYLAGLNSKQREAVEYGIKPGKTKGIGAGSRISRNNGSHWGQDYARQSISVKSLSHQD